MKIGLFTDVSAKCSVETDINLSLISYFKFDARHVINYGFFLHKIALLLVSSYCPHNAIFTMRYKMVRLCIINHRHQNIVLIINNFASSVF